MRSSHKLNKDEADMINSILDQEEMNIDNIQNTSATLSVLDDQCRQIWPNWDAFSTSNRTRVTPTVRDMKTQDYGAFQPEKTNPPIRPSYKENFSQRQQLTPNYSSTSQRQDQMGMNSPYMQQKRFESPQPTQNYARTTNNFNQQQQQQTSPSYSKQQSNYDNDYPQTYQQKRYQPPDSFGMQQTDTMQSRYQGRMSSPMTSSSSTTTANKRYNFQTTTQRSPQQQMNNYNPPQSSYGYQSNNYKPDQIQQDPLEKYDIQSMKNDIDSLYSRINALSSKSSSPSASSSARLTPPKPVQPSPTQRESALKTSYGGASQQPTLIVDDYQRQQTTTPSYGQNRMQDDRPSFEPVSTPNSTSYQRNAPSYGTSQQQRKPQAPKNRFSGPQYDFDDSVTQSTILDDSQTNDAPSYARFQSKKADISINQQSSTPITSGRRQGTPIQSQYSNPIKTPDIDDKTQQRRTTFDFNSPSKTTVSATSFNTTLNSTSMNMSMSENDELVKLRTENFMMRTELSKVNKRLQISELENKRLEDALEKSAKLIERYKQQLAQYQK